MNNLIWLIRASRWARNPPSAGRVALVLVIITVALVIAGLEFWGWWPEWATMERSRGIHLQRP
ncbi:hypothetical protein RGQ15_07900 [Paracoccus sp. MBLB3053]|uniref:Uncharacterized protein n=1 Tax=Paracoccus aurantius TaxID=3073814 RepID=A0ABU2HR33_9RHOB|nr:hypothetical protein [Paracoccus sp. MBLB3053]MDS9467496.1 hypothetical protein [Paracoccus sp. MBLB3053]